MKHTVELASPSFGEIVQRDLQRLENQSMRAARHIAAGLKDGWRAEIVAAGLGNRLSNTINSRVYPEGASSINAAAMVWTKAPRIVASHDEGSIIRSSDGFWLAIPLEAAGRGRFGRRITPGEFEQRTGQCLRFIYRGGRTGLLVVENARITGRGLARRKGGRRRKRDGILTGAQTVPVFVLVRQVRLPKRTDLMGEAERVAAQLPAILDGWV